MEEKRGQVFFLDLVDLVPIVLIVRFLTSDEPLNLLR